MSIFDNELAAMAQNKVALQYAAAETFDFFATDVVVQCDRRFADFEK